MAEPNGTKKLVKLGDWVIVRINEGLKYVISVIDEKSVVKLLHKKTFLSKALVGLQYGEFLEFDKRGTLKPWDVSKRVQLADIDDKDYELVGDNRNIKRNDPSVQKLSFEQIEDLKKNEEVEGAKMIEMMAAANATFENKTVFAQEKYLKKKQQKHLLYFQILTPTPRTVSEAYFCKGPQKILYVRPDTLAQILSLGNIHSGQRILVHETCSGLITASINERLAGNGSLISLYTERDLPINNAFRCFNFTKELQDICHYVPFHQFDILVNTPLDQFTASPFPEDFPFKNSKKIEELRKIREIMEIEVDNLVICSKMNPTDTLLELFKYLSPSGNVVIYHPHIQPLLECHEMLHESGEAISLELREVWFRDYQVLPLRTHPKMKMHGTGGYLLSATKVLYSDKIENFKKIQKQNPNPHKRRKKH